MSAIVLVPDASVLLKWILRSDDEPDRDRALELKTAWLALAIRHRGTMLTADRAYVKKAARAGHVKLLNDWRAPAAGG